MGDDLKGKGVVEGEVAKKTSLSLLKTRENRRQYERRKAMSRVTGKSAFVGLVVLCSLVLGIFLTAHSALAAKPLLKVWLLRTFVADANEVLEKQIRDWAKAKGVELQIQYLTYADIGTKYIAAIEAGEVPDVGFLPEVGPARYHGMGQLMDVTDLAQEIFKANGGLFDKAYPSVKFDGRIWAVPHFNMVGAWFVRKDLLKKAGLQPPRTWDEVIKVAEAVTDPQKGVYGLGQTFNRSVDGDGTFLILMRSFGASLTDETGKRITFNSPETLKALKWATCTFTCYKGKKRIQPPGAEGWTDPSNNEAWLAGSIAQTQNSASIYYALVKKKHPLEKDTLIIKMPAGPNGAFSRMTLWHWGIFKKTKQPKLAKDLVRYIMSPDNLRQYTESALGQAAPVYNRIAELPYWQQNENFKAILENARISVLPSDPGPMTAAAAEVYARHIFTDMCSRVIVGGLTPEEALAEATKRIEEIYATLQ